MMIYGIYWVGLWISYSVFALLLRIISLRYNLQFIINCFAIIPQIYEL